MKLKSVLLSICVGFLSGSAASLFLFLLQWVTRLRIETPQLVYFLPLAGFLIGFVFHRFGKKIDRGNNLVIDQITAPSEKIPLLMAPLILWGTLVTHLFGGSAGREGTAVQMGASLSDSLCHFFKVSSQERKRLLLAGAGSGFGAAIGAPWAGVLFGMEMIRIGPFQALAVFECLIASWVAVLTTFIFKAPHTQYLHPQIPAFSLKVFFLMVIAGICFGLLAYLFSTTTHSLEKILTKRIPKSSWRALTGGLLLVLFFGWEGSHRYEGLGLSVIHESMLNIASWKDVVFKLGFTALTLAAGFKGGEFIPLVFMGSALGSFLTSFFQIPGLEPGFLAALGFAAVFGSASNTPIACTVMAAELFGWKITPFAFLVCFVSYLFSGPHGIYSSQKKEESKLEGLLRWFRWKKR